MALPIFRPAPRDRRLAPRRGHPVGGKFGSMGAAGPYVPAVRFGFLPLRLETSRAWLGDIKLRLQTRPCKPRPPSTPDRVRPAA
jgi:hypothetical protein